MKTRQKPVKPLRSHLQRINPGQSPPRYREVGFLIEAQQNRSKNEDSARNERNLKSGE